MTKTTMSDPTKTKPHSKAASISTDVLIIGGGIAGMSLAYCVSNAGRDTIVVDASSDIPEHSTGRSAALFSESYASSVSFAALTSASKAFFYDPPQAFTDGWLVEARDTVYVSGVTAAEFAALDVLYKKMANFPANTKLVTRNEILELVPAFRRTFPYIGILEQGSGDLDVHEIWSGFRKGAKAAGCKIMTSTEVVGAKRYAGGWLVETTTSRIFAAVVVNASGAWGDVVGTMFGARSVGLLPKRRTALTIESSMEFPADMPFAFLTSDDLYFRCQNGVFLMSPADETDTVPRERVPR